MINYALMQSHSRGLKASLTRAKNTQDPTMRATAVLRACTKAVEVWEQCGAWPDNWSAWQRALDDAYLKQGGFARAPRLEDIV